MNKNMLAQALKVTMPVFFGYISIGIPFGLLVVNAGYPWWLSPLMGIAMFTGAGQFFAIALFSTGTVLSVIVLAEFLLSIRHIFYGLSLIERYKNHIRRRPYLMYSITDETFALVTTVDVPAGVDAGKFYNLVSFLDQSYWVIGCTIGAGTYEILEAYNLTQYLAGIDFALTALFVVLAVEQILSRHDVAGPVVGALICGFTVWLFKAGRFDSSGIIWVSICFGLAILFLLRGKSFYKNSRMENGDIVPSEKKRRDFKSRNRRRSCFYGSFCCSLYSVQQTSQSSFSRNNETFPCFRPGCGSCFWCCCSCDKSSSICSLCKKEPASFHPFHRKICAASHYDGTSGLLLQGC